MGIRLIFLNHVVRVISEEVTQKSKPAGIRLPVQGRREALQAKPGGRGAILNPESRARIRRKTGEAAQFRCQENPRREFTTRPYRKPTQVGEENILRRASELSLRN